MSARIDRLRKRSSVGFCEHCDATLGSYVGNVLIILKTLVIFDVLNHKIYREVRVKDRIRYQNCFRTLVLVS